MALRTPMLKLKTASYTTSLAHHFSAFMDASIHRSPPPCVLPENDRTVDDNGRDLDSGFELPGLPFCGGMELMAVPKRKTSPHKRGIRNGPKALKPIPVIVRCRSCGRVKLPHFYCCSGDRGNPGEKSDTAN